MKRLFINLCPEDFEIAKKLSFIVKFAEDPERMAVAGPIGDFKIFVTLHEEIKKESMEVWWE